MYLESTREKRTTLRTKDNEVDRQKAKIGTEELECTVSNSIHNADNGISCLRIKKKTSIS